MIVEKVAKKDINVPTTLYRRTNSESKYALLSKVKEVIDEKTETIKTETNYKELEKLEKETKETALEEVQKYMINVISDLKNAKNGTGYVLLDKTDITNKLTTLLYSKDVEKLEDLITEYEAVIAKAEKENI